MNAHTYPPLPLQPMPSRAYAMQPVRDPITSPNPPLPSAHSTAIMEPPNTFSRNSNHPQRSAAEKAVEKPSQIEDVPTEDTIRKKTLAAFQLPSKTIPDDAGHIKDALWFHIQLFGRLLQKGAVIGPTPPDVHNEFNRFFNCLEDVTTTHDNTTTSATALGSEHHRINVAKVELAYLPPNSTPRVKLQYRRMQSFMLGYMQATLACYGMRCWNPDLTEPSDSLFNVACRFVVLGTFRQALVTRTYAAYKIPLWFADSYDLLSKIYDHIVHFHYAARFRKEQDNPGSVLVGTELQARLTRRARLSKLRINWLTANKYPSRYIALCQPAATSDDELDPNDSTKKTYRILRRPERSTEVERWIRCLEMKHIQDNKYKRGGSRQYRRHIPAAPIDSPITTLPHNMPLDYFDPGFFNQLQYHTQQVCAAPATIAIPRNEKTWFTHSTEESLCNKDFNELHGADVLTRYQFLPDFDDSEANEANETDMSMEVTD